MSMATKTLGLSKSNPSAAQVTCSLRQYGGSMIGGIERLFKKALAIGTVRGVVVGSVATAILYKAKEKNAENDKEKLKRIRRRFREENNIKEAIVTEAVEMPAIDVEEKERFDTTDIQK